MLPPPDTTTTGHRRLLTESMFSMTHLPEEGSDVYRNAEALWQPIWARGVYGGTLIAQSLSVAQETTPAGFFVHSMHCHFVRAARTNVPVLYHVDRIRDGASVVLRAVRAHQSGTHIFSTTISFARAGVPSSRAGEAKKTLRHQQAFPAIARDRGPPTRPGEAIYATLLSQTCQADFGSMFECVRIPRCSATETEGRPETTRLLQWIRVRAAGGDDKERSVGTEGRIQAHLAALAYMTDHYFIGTALRAHRGARFAGAASVRNQMQSIDASTPQGQKTLRAFEDLAREEQEDNRSASNTGNTATTCPQTADMMVSLDHTIFFHEPAAVHADAWMLVEAETPWAGHERGLVVERIWTSDGVLVATCIQEGIVRLQQDEDDRPGTDADATSLKSGTYPSRL